MARRFILKALAWSVPFVVQSTVYAAEPNARALPEEYLSTGEQSTSLANGGSLSSGGYSAVRANPAMIATDKLYTLGGGYHWPSQGRDYYQAGVVDAKTSSIAAGCSYTSSMDDYEGSWARDGRIKPGDSPVKRRGALALAQNFKTFSLGLGGGFLEASDPVKTFSSDQDRVRGFTLGAGLVAGLSPVLRVGLSVENLANKKIAFAAPTIYRAGLVWAAVKNFSVYVDLRNREAVPAYEAPAPELSLFATETSGREALKAEQAATLGGIIRVFDLVRLSAGAGVSNAGGDNVNTMAGGVALVNKSFVLAYGAQRPDLRAAAVHHTTSLGIDVSL